MAIAFLAGLASIGLALAFDNSQRSKWHYMFQAYVWPGKRPSPPENFTGTWREWHANGVIALREHWINGRLTGLRTAWWPNGNKGFQCSYVEGKAEGRSLEWDQNGNVIVRGSYRNGKPWEGRCYIYEGKAWRAVYREGKPWLGLVPSGEATGMVDLWKFYINGRVSGTMRNGQHWDGIFLDVDGSTGHLVTKWYREGRETRGATTEGTLWEWHDSTGAFVDVPWPPASAGPQEGDDIPPS